MFLENKYSRWYFTVIANAKNNFDVAEYHERHHIVPKSIGGTNESANLVKLTAREHFVCHWLLTKMTEGPHKSKMIYALNGMRRSNKNQLRYETKITSRVYAKVKNEAAEISKVQNLGKLTEQHKLNISRGLKGKPKSEEWKNKVRKPKANKLNYQGCQIGRILTEEHKNKLRKPKTTDHIQKIKDRIITDEWREKLSVAAKARWATKK